MYKPLYFIIIYHIFVFLLAQFGPVQYVDFSAVKVGSYLTLIIIAVSIGYVFAISRPLKTIDSVFQSRSVVPESFFEITSLVTIGGLFLTLAVQLSSGSANFDFSAIGDTYISGYKNYELNSGNYSATFILYSMFVMPNFIATIWGLYYFRDMAKIWKIVSAAIIFLFPLLFTVLNGTQKSIGDLIIYILAVFFIKAVANNRLYSLRNILIFLIAAIGGSIALQNILSQRYKFIGVNIDNISTQESYHIVYDSGNIIFRIFGPEAGFPIAVLTGYLTNGLNGLSYCLNLPTTWSTLMGTSYSVSVIADRVFGVDFPYLNTYPHQAGIQYGWGETRWHSVFSWFASDFTFAGTIPIFGFLGYVYARAWAESIRFQNPYSILLFCLLSMGVIMMPANNQLMQTPGALLTLIVIVILYLRYRLPFNRPRPART
jgi:hypothetical protein